MISLAKLYQDAKRREKGKIITKTAMQEVIKYGTAPIFIFSGGTTAPGAGYRIKIKEKDSPVSDTGGSFTLTN